MTKFCCISDLHGYLPNNLPDCDAILIAGDICCHGSVATQLQWLDYQFRNWLLYINKPVIACCGNHDWVFYQQPEQIKNLNLPWVYLQDSYTIFNRLKIYGTPWQLKFMNWAFNLSENQLIGKWNLIPDDIDILICHGPPRYYGDRTVDGDIVGSESLTWRIQQIQPMAVICGHIHEGYGQYQIGPTKIINASINDENYKPINSPIIITI